MPLPDNMCLLDILPTGMARLVSFSFALVVVLLPAPLFAQTASQVEFFEKNIRPLFSNNCQACHNPQLKTGGLDLSTAEGFMHGGASGPLVDNTNPAESRLLKVTGYDERIKMPPMGKLSQEDLDALRTWVEFGAPWPGARQAAEKRPDSATREFSEEERKFWAFRPMKEPELPRVRNEAWVQSPIDRFILSRLEEEGIEPAPSADKATLLRRASYDLTGLPPTEQEITSFLEDDSENAFDKVVDSLLDSKRYGEKWARHWLDVARYADSTGNDEDHRYPYAWRYRDYVIQAFNDDMPYDQFIREQIAGDLLPADQPGQVNRRGTIATGFLALGPKAIAQQDKKKMLYDVYDEQLDVVSKAFLGLTITCARCHDHKFDPILTKDYYSLIGMFASTRSFKDPTTHVAKLLFTPLVPEEEYAAYTAHQDKIDDNKIAITNVVDEQLEGYSNSLSPKLADYMLAARKSEHGVSVDDVAKANGLDTKILGRWVEYLKPESVPQPHLTEWREASADDLEEIAQGYQQRYQERLDEWHARLAKWRESVARSLKAKNMPPPMKPRFVPGEDRFFHEVSLVKGGPFALDEEDREKVFSREARDKLAELKAQEKMLNETMPPEPDMACAVQEGETVAQQVFVRGDHGSPGEGAPKVFPAILEGHDQEPVATGSGRLELADWLTRRDHPLTARVMANRIWQGHFGQGIVRTPSNFGKMGERPTHPELLDYLALRFIDSGWSIKQMHRTIMLSSTYRMSSTVSDKQNAADPQNRLLSHFQRRRLAVEEMRDGLLAIDGSIDLTMGGTLQTGFGTDRENSNKRLSMNPDEINRRLIYIPLRRANLAPLLNLFDFGDATTPLGKRPVTNVAPQALFLMNSEFVAARARNLASELLSDDAEDDPRRMKRAYLATLNRVPAPDEIDTGLSYVSRLKQRFPDTTPDIDAWMSLCRVLMASNDFIYVD